MTRTALALHIDQVEARLRFADRPYKAEVEEIEAQIAALQRRLRALHWARCEVAKPFEIELDRLYEIENQEEAA